MKQVGLFHPYKRKISANYFDFLPTFIHTRSTVTGSAVMSGFASPFRHAGPAQSTFRAGHSRHSIHWAYCSGVRTAFIRPAICSRCCAIASRDFSAISFFPAFGPVLPHGLSLFQANRVNLFYLFVRERQVFFHPIGHLFRNLLRSKFFVFGTTIMVWAHTVPLPAPALPVRRSRISLSTTILIVIGLYNRMYSCKPSANLFRQMEKRLIPP